MRSEASGPAARGGPRSTGKLRAPAAGFTLIETVVALLIVALGMTAVFVQLNQVSSNAIYLQDKTLASWIGSNAVTELSLADEWPEPGESEDEIEFAGRDWWVRTVVSETEVENLRRADVSVGLVADEERVIHTVSGLIEPPTAGQLPPVDWINAGRGGGFGGGQPAGPAGAGG